MRRAKWRYGAWLVAIVLGATQPVWAGPVDCTDANNAVAQAICDNPTLHSLDRKMVAAYHSALQKHPEQAQALQRDQDDWRAGRDDHAWRLLSRPDLVHLADRKLTKAYRKRIRFLRGVYDASHLHSRFLTDLFAALRVGRTAPHELLTRVGAESARETGMPAQGWSAALPAPPDRALGDRLRDWRATHGLTRLAWLPKAGFGGIYSYGGTADCVQWQFFALHGKTLHAVERARVAVGCRNTGTHLVRYDGRVLLVQIRRGIKTPTVNLQVQRWLGDHWGDPDRLLVRFARKVRLQDAGCAPGVACGAFKTQAVRIARRYDRQPLPQAFDARVEALSEPEQDRIRQLRTAVQCGEDGPSWPGFGARRGWPASFGREASRFPMRLDGQLAIACIGHGYIGWHTSADWLLGVWTVGDGKPVPLAGAVLGGVGVYLAAAPLQPHIATR